MTDRELLELAAKAAGIKVDWRESVGCLCYSDSPYNVAWSPLKDDGDALRLAVKLTLRVSVNRALGLRCPGSVTVEYPAGGDGYYIALAEAVCADRPEAATRRAIVRAAAAIATA